MRLKLFSGFLLTVLAVSVLVSCGTAEKKKTFPELNVWGEALVTSDAQKFFEIVNVDILSRPGLSNPVPDSVLSRKSRGALLTEYDPKTGSFEFPVGMDAGDFFRRFSQAVSGNYTAPPEMDNSGVRMKEIAAFIVNYQTLREIGLYLRLGKKLADRRNPYAEEIYAQSFALAAVEAIERADPVSERIRKSAADYLDKMFENSTSQVKREMKNALDEKKYNEVFTDPDSVPERLVLLYRFSLALSFLSREEAPELKGLSNTAFRIPEKQRLDFFHTSRPSGDYQVITLTSLGSPSIVKGRDGYERNGMQAVDAGPGGTPYFTTGWSVYTPDGRFKPREVVSGVKGYFAPSGLSVLDDGRIVFAESKALVMIDLEKDRVERYPLEGPVPEGLKEGPGGVIPVAASSEGIFVADASGKRILAFSTAGVFDKFITLPGAPGGLAAGAGGIYVSLTDHHVVGFVEASGDSKFRVVAGLWNFPGHGDGKGFDVFLNRPMGLDVADDGTVYVADGSNHAVRKIDADGTVTTIAGEVRGYSDGAAAEALLDMPVDVAVTARGLVYVAEGGAPRVRAILRGSMRPSVEPPKRKDESLNLQKPDREIDALSKKIAEAPIGYELVNLLVQRAEKLRDLEYYDMAVEQFRRALALSPGNPGIMLEIGETRLAKGDSAGAIETFRKIVDIIKPSSSSIDSKAVLLNVYLELGRALVSKGDYLEAEKTFESFFRARQDLMREGSRRVPSGKVAEAFYLAGKAKFFSEKYAEALKDFRNAVQLNPQFYEAVCLEGAVYLMQNKLVKAKLTLEKSLNIKGSYPLPHLYLGRLFGQKEKVWNPKKAVFHYNRYVKLGGKDEELARGLIADIEKTVDDTNVNRRYHEEINRDSLGRYWKVRIYENGLKEEPVELEQP